MQMHCQKTCFGTPRAASPTKSFTKNSHFVGADALVRPIMPYKI